MQSLVPRSAASLRMAPGEAREVAGPPPLLQLSWCTIIGTVHAGSGSKPYPSINPTLPYTAVAPSLAQCMLGSDHVHTYHAALSVLFTRPSMYAKADYAYT